MIKKLFSVLLVLVMFFSIFTVAVAVDEEDYDVILLPVISDQLEQNKQVTQVQLYIDKKTNTAFVDLDVICELIGANCNYKKDWYIVDRDYTYFKYKGSGDMKLYLSHTDSGLLLLEGDLFESRMINNRWYVDYIKFCDMYGVKLQKIDSSIKSYITDDRFGDCYKKYINFEKNPYYIQMDTGVTLSSIYGEIIENKERYFWDYSSWSADDDSDIISKVLLSEAGISVGVQGGNLFSNIINDWDGFTSAIFSDYESDEHYTEALTDICNVKYINNAVKYKIDDPCKNDTMADTLQKGLTLWSTYDMYNESTEFFDKLLETNDYKEIFSSTDKSLKFEDIFSSVSKVGLNAVQKYCEQLMLCKRLNNISETKINMLQKGILENDSILNKAKNQEKVNDIITAIGKNPVNINNALIPDNLKIRNPFSKIYLNTFNNSEGLKESAQKMSNMYKNVDEQKKDKFNKIIETVKFSVSDEMIQTVFKNSGSAELSGFAFAMGIFDGMMGIAKTEFGEQLKQLEKLAQYYYIEKTLLNDLDEKNPENLYNRLLFALEASLCCFQGSSDESENEIKAITEVLLELDYDTEKLNINYYHDPRNNNISDEIKDYIINYEEYSQKSTYNMEVMSGKIVKCNEVYYYLGYDENDNLNLYEGGVDGKSKNKIITVWEYTYIANYLEDIYTDGENLYYVTTNNITNNEIYCYDTKTKNSVKISDGNIEECNYEKTGFYFSNNDGFYLYDFQTKKSEKILDKDYIENKSYATCTNNTVYFVYPYSADNIYSVNIKNGDTKTISTKKISEQLFSTNDLTVFSNIVVANNKLYFIIYTADGSAGVTQDSILICMDFDGSNMKYISLNDLCKDMNFVNNIDYIDNSNNIYIINKKINIDNKSIIDTNIYIEYYNDKYIYYLKQEELNQSYRFLYQSDVNGLNEQKILSLTYDIESTVSFSYGSEDNLFLANIETRNYGVSNWRGEHVKYETKIIDIS